MLALVLLLVMVAMLDLDAHSDSSSSYVLQHHSGGQRWAGAVPLAEQSEDANPYKVELMSPLSSFMDEELIAIRMPGQSRSLGKVRRNAYKIVKDLKRKKEVDVVTQSEKTRSTLGLNEAGSQNVPLHQEIPEGRHPL